MMESFALREQPQFSNPQEEIEYLRGKIAEKERGQENTGEKKNFEKTAIEAIQTYANTSLDEALRPEYKIRKKEEEAIVLELSPESHDRKMEELYGLLEQMGILNTLSVIDKLKNPHIEADFHRFLVQLLQKGFPVKKLKEKSTLSRALHMTLFEVSLPEEEDEKDGKDVKLKEMISKMEQLYAGLLSVSDPEQKDGNWFVIEIANAVGSEEAVMYISVPNEKRELFEKQILSIFAHAKIKEQKDDYNIFNETGVTIGSQAVSNNDVIFPIKIYDEFDYDPLNVLLNTFSKIKKDGEGAAVQLVVKPCGTKYIDRYKGVLEEIRKGKSVKKAIKLPNSAFGHVMKVANELFETPEKKDKDQKENPLDQKLVEMIETKIAAPIAEVNLRVLASSYNRSDAAVILSQIESAFNQFENSRGNKITWKRQENRKLALLVKQFSYRMFSEDAAFPMNLRELTTLIHLPQDIKAAPHLRQAKAGSAPAPLGMPQTGILLGVNRNRNVETKIYMTPEDRLRHMYTIGQTGTGKTTLLKNMIAQDIANGDGVCFIDPHGSDIQDILSCIPKERYEDVIYFDPAYTPRPMALNMLEYDPRYPEQKTFAVNEMLSIFSKLFDMKATGGPMFEQYFRNATMLVIEDPESGSTLLDVSRVMANKAYRELKLSRCKNPIIVQFWREVADKAGGEASLANIVPYITSKFDVFLSNDIMRPIIAQQNSTFNFREIMDNKKILLVNLSKGRLGDINANLIGLILVGKILMAALSRVDSIGKNLPNFYLYIDEFQNITTDSIAQILSEARKYKLSLNIAHQFIAQIEEKIRDAVFGNVGSISAFRVGAEDAEFLEKQFEPVFNARDLINLDNRNAYMKLLVGGKPVKPFNMETLPPPKGRPEIVEQLKELSYLKYGRERSEVEEEISKKFASVKPPAPRPAL